MAQEKKPNWIWLLVVLAVIMVLAWAIYRNTSDSPQLNGLGEVVNEIVDKTSDKTVEKIEERLQDEAKPLKVAKMEVTNQTVQKQTVTEQTVATQNVETSNVQTQFVEKQVVTNQEVENQWVENSTVKNQTVENQTVANQTVNCQSVGTCGVVASVQTYQPPSCTSNCAYAGQARCVAECLTGDQREVCVRSGNCLVWQRQDCASGYYCDNGSCRARVIATVTEKKCYNGDVWNYVNGIRQGLVEDCGRTEYFSGSSYYRCSGNYREWKEKIERSCVQPFGGQAYCHAEEVWRVVESCPYGCENSMCKQKVIIQEPVCATGCCSGSCEQPTVIVNNNIVINNQTDPVSAPQQVIAPPPPPSVPTVSSGCTQNCTPVEIEGSSGTVYVPPSPLPPAPAPSAVVTTCTTCSSGWSPP